jgi:hypothetical protein
MTLDKFTKFILTIKEMRQAQRIYTNKKISWTERNKALIKANQLEAEIDAMIILDFDEIFKEKT